MTEARTGRKRMFAEWQTSEKTRSTQTSVASVVRQAREIFGDPGFVQFARAAGMRTLPRAVSKKPDKPQRADKNLPPNNDDNGLQNISLEFVTIWAFLFPLLGEGSIARYLEKRWPGFIWQLKDAFIALVVEGPFPREMSGHHKRRNSDETQLDRRLLLRKRTFRT